MNCLKNAASIMFLVAFSVLAYGGGTKEPTREQQQPPTQQKDNQIPTQQQPFSQILAQQSQVSQPSTNLTKNDGKGMRLGILVPQSQGLNKTRSIYQH